ncbi:MAG: hypothetical protein ING10_02270 [Roseomonas sp.]|nr:hypothetical protein [Roseomonas sp.]
MSFAFNPPNRYTVAGGRSQATGTGAATHRQDGLSISPEGAMSYRGNLLTTFILSLLGLGFLVVSSLFIATLVTIMLA